MCHHECHYIRAIVCVIFVPSRVPSFVTSGVFVPYIGHHMSHAVLVQSNA